MQEKLKQACLTGDVGIAAEMLSVRNEFDLASCLNLACRGGRKEMVELVIQKGCNAWNCGLVGACRGGHMEIVELMIEKGANNWNMGLSRACQGGHMEIVLLMIEKGADDGGSLRSTGIGGFFVHVKMVTCRLPS
jgi:hypothetical protein